REAARAADPSAPTIRRVLVVDALRRRPGRSPHQSGLGARGRSANRSGSVRTVTALPAGAVAVLVDDVVTTGATLAACRDALAGAGTVVVGALVLAATPAPARRRVPGVRAPVGTPTAAPAGPTGTRPA
ncbi:MAG: phosphoribosyltransferase family protein, partial [Georgenia sp.]